MVLLRQKKMTKLTTKFDPHPFKVIRIKGTMITVMRNEKYITCNASLFKPVKVDSVEQSKNKDDGEDDDLSSEIMVIRLLKIPILHKIIQIRPEDTQ